MEQRPFSGNTGKCNKRGFAEKYAIAFAVEKE
jgi:hypothetical protein